MKYIIKNCPCIWEHSGTKMLMCENGKKCAENTDCVIKQIVGLCKENQFFNYGAVMLGNGLSTDILDLLEIEEVDE